MRIAVVLLAAGRSTRFGDANKTMAPLHGIPLGEHAARTLAAGLAASGDGRRVCCRRFSAATGSTRSKG